MQYCLNKSSYILQYSCFCDFTTPEIRCFLCLFFGGLLLQLLLLLIERLTSKCKYNHQYISFSSLQVFIIGFAFPKITAFTIKKTQHKTVGLRNDDCLTDKACGKKEKAKFLTTFSLNDYNQNLSSLQLYKRRRIRVLRKNGDTLHLF